MPSDVPPELDHLIARYVAGGRDPALVKQVADAVADDAELRDELRDELALDRVLHEHGRMPLDPAPVLAAITGRRDSSLENLVMAGIAAATPPRRRAWTWGVAAAAVMLITTLAATAMVLVPPSGPLVETRPFASVHHIRGVQWPRDLPSAPGDGQRIPPGTLTLAAGVVEIRFDNAVVLALEGPAQIDLWSRMQAQLRHGRLTTNVPAQANGFTVVANHMRVIDLGTEVGIDLAVDGRAHVQVYTGAVEIALSDAVAAPVQRYIGAGEARRFDPATGALASAPFDGARFVRTGPRRPLALAVSDLIAGGDGRGTATWEGLDQATGALRSDVEIGGRRGGNEYRVVADLPFIDGVFMPAGQVPTVVDSAGHAYHFDLSGGHSYDLIRRGGFMIRPPDGDGVTVPTRSPTIIGGVDHAAFGHQLIGMHANAGVTIDLQEIATAYGQRPVRFSAAVANTAPRRFAQALAPVPRDAPTIASPVAWTVLEPRTVSTLAGTVLTPQGDGSVIAWPIKPTDTYVVGGTPGVARLSAIRLEVLPDETLPSRGPGASANGNFILTRIRAVVVSASRRSDVVFTGAVADFSQVNWPVASAIGNDDNAGWAVVPETGRAHTAVFFCNPLDVPADAQVEITMSQLNRRYVDHLIGRFRLAVTDARDPVRGLAVGAGSFMVLVDGRLAQRTVVPLADQAPARFDIPLLPTDRFLTLVSCDGGYGTRFQWTTLGDPRIDLGVP